MAIVLDPKGVVDGLFLPSTCYGRLYAPYLLMASTDNPGMKTRAHEDGRKMDLDMLKMTRV